VSAAVVRCACSACPSIIFTKYENILKVLVDSILQNLSYAFAYASGSIAYLAELMHLLGKSHNAVKNDIQNKINHLLRSDKRRRDTRDYDNIHPILGEDA
jgi:hypothetical protein